jgi:hypothetical protein
MTDLIFVYSALESLAQHGLGGVVVVLEIYAAI